MQTNYYFLKGLASELSTRLAALKCMACWTQEKDELVVEFAAARGVVSNYKPFFMKVILSSRVPLLAFPDDFDRAKKNSVDLFESIYDQSVRSVFVFENERALGIRFSEGKTLVLKLFGRPANILLFDEDQLVDQFHHQNEDDQNLRLNDLHRPIQQTEEAFEKADKNYFKIFPTFGKEIKEYYPKDLESWSGLCRILDVLNAQRYYVTTTGQLLLFAKDTSAEPFTSAIEAANATYLAYTRASGFEELRNEALKNLRRQHKQTTAYLAEARERLEDLMFHSRNEEKGHIIMANLHTIEAETEKVRLFDFYHNQEIDIALKKNLSPQANAETYYRKAKNEKIEVDKLSENIESREQIVKDIEEKMAEIALTDSYKELRKFLKEKSKGQSTKKTAAELFKCENFDGFEIWIGRNAKNNDLLTQQYAFKEDLWLHARDSPGSHVLLKFKAGKGFPTHVIEYAAGRAAWHSKRKSEGLVPVICTPKKFVRKPKKAPDGQVIVEREEVIMIEPRDV